MANTVTATGLWPPLAAPLLNVLALLLALGFRRNRAVLALVTLTFASVALAGPEERAVQVTTEVELREASQADLAWYVSTKEPMDKAGAYAIQGIGGFLVRAIRGSYSCVVGLPLVETLALLEAARFPLPWSAR